MNRLLLKKRELILKCLVDGMSLLATSRIACVAENTVARLQLLAGEVACDFQDEHLRNLKLDSIELDEIWSFVYVKQKRLEQAKRPPENAGDSWVWIAIDRKTKLVPCWLVGGRSQEDANLFIEDLAQRLSGAPQLTSDAYALYIEAIYRAFGSQVDYAMLKKEHKPDSPSRKTRISGDPDDDLISTSIAERQNLTMRMSMRRFTRRTNAFSKRFRNHAFAVALYYLNYNFCRVHQTIETTPAIKAGVTNRRLSLLEVAQMTLEAEPKPNRPKRYRKQNRDYR